MSIWYWTSSDGDFEATTSWNDTADGSGLAPTNFLTGGAGVQDDDTIVFHSNGQSVTTGYTGHTSNYLNVVGSKEYGGSIATEGSGLDVGLGEVRWGGSGSVAHFAGDFHTSAAINNIYVDRTGNAPNALILSGDYSTVTGDIQINSGNVKLLAAVEIEYLYIYGGYVWDELGAAIESIVLDGGEFDSQNSPNQAGGAGSGGLTIYTGKYTARGSANFAMYQFGGLFDYRGSGNITSALLVAGKMETTSNPNTFAFGTSDNSVQKYRRHILDLRGPGAGLIIFTGSSAGSLIRRGAVDPAGAPDILYYPKSLTDLSI